MHSERLGKPSGVHRKLAEDVMKKATEVETDEGNIMYFSIKPMHDKTRGKENIERHTNRNPKTTYATAFDEVQPLEKYSARGQSDLYKTSKEKRVTPPQFHEPVHNEPELTSGRSYRVLSQFYPPNDENGAQHTQNKVLSSQGALNKLARPNIQRFPFPNFAAPAPGHAKKNSSMISSKSYEILEAIAGAAEEEKSSSRRPDDLLKNKTMANFGRILEQTRDVRKPAANFFIEETIMDRSLGAGNRALTTQPGTRSPNESFVFRNGGADRSLVAGQGFANSPAHSVVRAKTYDRSKMSALNRSDMSKISNGNTSFLTRKGDEGELSRIAAQQADSNIRGGMSKTWVKSGLMESREEISTIKQGRNRILDKSGVGDRSALDMSDEKSAKKKNLYQEIEELFSRELQPSSKESSNTSVKAKEYELEKCIGQGAYAKVYKALHKPTKTKVAIKLYEKAKLTEKLRQKSIKREIKILSRLSHQNIVSFIDCFSTTNHIYLVMELVRGYSLYELLKQQPERKIKETNARPIIKMILKAMVYCHSKCVTHRDIKLENVIITSTGVIKVIDFGFSTCIPNDKKVKMFCGTPSYMAPEIAQKTEYCGPPVDIWAIGVLFFVLISGKFPFKGSTDKKLYHRISCNEPIFDEGTSEETKAVILQMMSKDPDRRPTALELLNSSFFNKKRENSTSKSSFEVSKANLSVRNTSNQNLIPSISPVPKENKSSQPSSTKIQLGKTTRLFNDMLTTLGRDGVVSPLNASPLQHTNNQFNQFQIGQLQSPIGMTQPLRDDTKRTINGYFNKTPNMTNGLNGCQILPNDKERSARDLWPSKIKREEPKSIRVEPRKLLDDREKSATKKSATNLGAVTRDLIKDRYKKLEDMKPAQAGFKRTITEERLKYDRGDFTRFLGYK